MNRLQCSQSWYVQGFLCSMFFCSFWHNKIAIDKSCVYQCASSLMQWTISGHLTTMFFWEGCKCTKNLPIGHCYYPGMQLCKEKDWCKNQSSICCFLFLVFCIVNHPDNCIHHFPTNYRCLHQIAVFNNFHDEILTGKRKLWATQCYPPPPLACKVGDASKSTCVAADPILSITLHSVLVLKSISAKTVRIFYTECFQIMNYYR